MKWYAYPLAMVAWLLVACGLFIMAWNWAGESQNPAWLLGMFAVAGVFFGICFALTYLKLAWELEVLIQVVLVLGPLLWYLNQREPYKPPVYVFFIEAGYTGEVRTTFSNDDATKTQVRSTADTLYFRFDSDGRMLLNEDFRTVQEAMQNRFYYVYPDGSRKKIELVSKGASTAPDSTKFLGYVDTIAAVKGKINYISWELQRADRLK